MPDNTSASKTEAKPKRQTLPPMLPPDQWQIAKQIAQQLHEPLPVLIAFVIKSLGVEAAQTLLQQTLEIEAQGGMMLANGSRRRTPGGVFLFLAKQQLPPEDAQRLYSMSNRKHKRQKDDRQKTKSAPKPAEPELPPFVWNERHDVISALREAPGTATTAKVMLIGRPELYELFTDLAYITLTHLPRLNSLPRGVPHPESGLESTYAVLIGLKQWKKAEAALLADESDFLIIEGMYAFNEQLSGMAVYATNATTRNLQIQQRLQKQ